MVLETLRVTMGKDAELKLLLGLALIVIVLLAGPVASIPLLIPIDYNEGWNAFHAVHAHGTRPLYPGPSALITNNYPPLSFYIVSLLGRIISDNIIAGRIIALLSYLIVALNIGLIVRRLNGPPTIAWFSALLFLAMATIQCRSYVGNDDPQWLAHAFVTAGLFIFLGADHRSIRVVLTAVVMFSGGMIKHSVIPLPLVVTVWLFFYDRARFGLWIAISTGLLAASAYGCYLAYGPNCFTSIFATSTRSYELVDLGVVGSWTTKFGMLLVAPLIVSFHDSRPEMRLLLLYTLVSVVWGFFILGGAGVDINAMFDVYIALSIETGLAIEALASRVKLNDRSAARLAAMALVATSVLLSLPAHLRGEDLFAGRLGTRAATSRADIEYLASVPGRAMCEDLALCYWAGKEFEVDFFNTGQKISKGAMSDRLLVELLDNKAFSILQVDGDEKGQPATGRLPRNVMQRILANYAVERRSDVGGMFLRPATK